MTKRPLLFAASLAIGLCGLSTTSRAGTIVPGLKDATALNSFTAADQTVTETRGAVSSGLTLAVRLTPNAADLYNSFTGPVNLLDIGGTQNGSALVLLDGQYWFISKSNNGGAAAPTGIADRDGIDNAVGVVIGAAVPDKQADLYASFDGVNARLVVSLDGNAVSHDLAHVPHWNWKGNGSLTFAGINNVLNGRTFGSRGGLSEAESSRFYTNRAATFTGAVSLGQYFNAVASS